jgi:hypothetical protein
MRFVDVMDDFTGYIRIPILEVGYSMLCTLDINDNLPLFTQQYLKFQIGPGVYEMEML